MAELWFSASVRILCLIEDEGATTQDQCVHIFRATDWDDAFGRALHLGRSHEKDYLNGDGKRVRWRLDRVATLDMIRAPDLDGAEVFSQMSEVSGGPPFDTEFQPEKHRPSNTGI